MSHTSRSDTAEDTEFRDPISDARKLEIQKRVFRRKIENLRNGTYHESAPIAKDEEYYQLEEEYNQLLEEHREELEAYTDD